MQTQTTQTQPAAPHWTEAPASMTVKVIDAAGFEWLCTVRGGDVRAMLHQASELKSLLVKAGARPATNGHNGNGHAQASAPEAAAPTCAIHKTPMVRRSKDGRSWWSCNQKLDTGEWCPYKPRG